MITNLKPEVVIANRGGRDEVVTLHSVLNKDVIDPESGRPKIDRLTNQPVPGEELGMAVITETQQMVYALRSQLRVPKDGEVEALREREALAVAELVEGRKKLWEGGGKVVYTV